MSSPLNEPRHPWARLTAAARTAPAERDAAAPYGFATRVAALALAQERRMVSLLERLSFRAVGVAAVLALGSVALNYSVLTGGGTPAQAEVDMLHADDAVSIVLDLTAQE